MPKKIPRYKIRSLRRIVVIGAISFPLLFTISIAPPIGPGIAIAVGLCGGIVCFAGFGFGAKCHVTRTRGGKCTHGSLGVLGGCDDHFDHKLDAAWHSLGERNRLAWTLAALRTLDRQRSPIPPALPSPGEHGYYEPSIPMKILVLLYEIWAVLAALNIVFLLAAIAVNAVSR